MRLKPWLVYHLSYLTGKNSLHSFDVLVFIIYLTLIRFCLNYTFAPQLRILLNSSFLISSLFNSSLFMQLSDSSLFEVVLIFVIKSHSPLLLPFAFFIYASHLAVLSGHSMSGLNASSVELFQVYPARDNWWVYDGYLESVFNFLFNYEVGHEFNLAPFPFNVWL